MDNTTIFNSIISWIVAKVLDLFFGKAKRNEEIIEIYEKRLEEKDMSIEKLRKETEKRGKERYRIIQSLKRSGLSVSKLVERYDRPLSAILISYATQKESAGAGSSRPSKFVLEELQKYNVRYLGGTDALIPPAKIPEGIKNRDDLRIWFENGILKGRYCKLKFLALIDLRDKTYWDSNLPYVQIAPKHFTLGEVLSVEDLFTEGQINRIALSDIIRDGDIGWLASYLLSGHDLEIIHKNQTSIEDKLRNPSLRQLSDESITAELSNVLAEYGIANSDQVSKAIVKEARFWSSRLI